MLAQINVRLLPTRKQDFRKFCVAQNIGMQNVLLACVEALLLSEKSREFTPFFKAVILRAKQLHAEAVEL